MKVYDAFVVFFIISLFQILPLMQGTVSFNQISGISQLINAKKIEQILRNQDFLIPVSN